MCYDLSPCGFLCVQVAPELRDTCLLAPSVTCSQTAQQTAPSAVEICRMACVMVGLGVGIVLLGDDAIQAIKREAAERQRTINALQVVSSPFVTVLADVRSKHNRTSFRDKRNAFSSDMMRFSTTRQSRSGGIVHEYTRPVLFSGHALTAIRAALGARATDGGKAPPTPRDAAEPERDANHTHPRKRAIIESVNDRRKNIRQVEHTAITACSISSSFSWSGSPLTATNPRSRPLTSITR